jgi:hypothetical protein
MRYEYGRAKGDTKSELGKDAIEHIGLKLEDDENIGKHVKFINPKVPYEHGVFKIIARQTLWGYNDEGKYTLVKGYRGVKHEDDFGKAFTLDKVEFVEEL